MKQYIELLKEIYEHGEPKGPARKGMPGTKEVFCRTMTFDLQEGFPLLTCRKMFTRGMAHELIWLLSGDTNIKYLVDNNVHIWDNDAYKFYKRRGGKLNKETWLDFVKSNMYDSITKSKFGDLGFVYGHQWRSFKGFYDQIRALIKGLKENPNSRYHIVTAWDPVPYLVHSDGAALPACHILFQCSIRGEYLDIMMLQRSCDMVLGVPFDIAEYAMLCHILALEIGKKPGVFTWVGNSCHIYDTHMDAAKELISRENDLLPLCNLKIAEHKPFDKYEAEDFIFENYKSLPAVKAKLCVGE